MQPLWAGFKSIDERISFISDPGRPVEPVARPVGVTPPKVEKEQEKKSGGLFDWIRKMTSSDFGGQATDPY